MGLWSSKYTTSKTVKVRSKRFYGVYLSVMIGILLFIVLYVLYSQKKYQKNDIGITGTTVEMNGVAYGSGMYERVLDADDVMHSPTESQSFFLTTSLITSREQTPSVCPEDAASVNASCSHDSDCSSNGSSVQLQHGLTTGKCNRKTRTCEIRAWCPVERPYTVNDTSKVEGLEEFTLKIDGYVHYPEFNQTVSSVQEFKIKEIVRRAHLRAPELQYEDITDKGGIISIQIIWNCDFDPLSEPCEPSFSFERLDFQGNEAQGHSYHYTTNYFKGNNGLIEYRRLHRAFGIRFMILEQANGGRFDFLEFVLNVGSTLSYFGVAVIVCDMAAEWFLDDSYKDSKYETTPDVNFRCFCRGGSSTGRVDNAVHKNSSNAKAGEETTEIGQSTA